MNIPEYDKTTAFLSKHNHIVKCTQTESELVCRYDNMFCVKYRIEHIDNNMYDLSINYYKDPKQTEEVIERIFLPVYTLRWFIFLDILRLCRRYKLSHNIVRFIDKEGNIKDLPNLLDVEMKDEDISAEQDFSTPITEILTDQSKINNFDNRYISKGLFYDFLILKGLLV